MAGAAMPMRDTTTWKMAFWAAAVDSPRRFPFSSVTGIPNLSSLQGEQGVRGPQGTWVVGIKEQGRDTAYGHVSTGSWYPPLFPIHCLRSKSGLSQLDLHSHLGGPQQSWMGMGTSQLA